MSDPRDVHIVHSDVAVRDALESLMIVEGIGVQMHASVYSFFESVRDQDEGRLLLDVDMSDFSAADFLAKMNEQRIALKIVAVSAFAEAQPKNRALDAVATTFLETPSELDKVVSSTHAALAPPTVD
jgi:two-component system response regulator FixJ